MMSGGVFKHCNRLLKVVVELLSAQTLKNGLDVLSIWL